MTMRRPRPVLMGDLIAVARLLLGRPDRDWRVLVFVLLLQADRADAFRRCYNRAHPQWGDGSLMALCATHHRPPEPRVSDLRYLRALACTIDAMLFFKLSFVSAGSGLYDGRQEERCEDDGHGRNTREDGDDRSGLAAHL